MRNSKKKVAGFLFVVGLIGVTIMLIRRIRRKYVSMLDKANKECAKQAQLFHVTEQWLKAKIHGNHVVEYLKEYNYTNVAIYGMAHLGQNLIDELEDTSICIKYGIDRDAEVYWDTFPIVKPEELSECDFTDVDVVIVTPVTYYAEIKGELSSKLDCPIISLEEII